MASVAKIFTVTRNETDLIESFLLYHGHIFGYNNIVVIDNASTCPVVRGVYSKYVRLGVTVVNEPVYAGASQGSLFTKYMNKHKHGARFLIGLDTDEFLYLRGPASTPQDISRYLDSIPAKISRLVVRAFFSSVPDVTSPHYVDQKITNPAAQINTFKHDHDHPNKCIFRADCFVSSENGCLGGQMSRGESTPCNRIAYFHFHNTGARRSIERAMTVVHGCGYANTNAPLLSQLECVSRAEASIGSRRVLEYGMFLSKALCLQEITRKGKWPTQEQLLSVSRAFPTLLRRPIDVSHMSNIPEGWETKYDSLLFHDPVENGEFLHNGVKNTVVEQMQPPSTSLKCKPLKKVALLLSGHIRNFEPRKAFWVDFNNKFGDRVDIYVHTWNESGVRSQKEWIDVGKVPPSFDEIRAVLKPKKMLVEDHSEKIDSFSLKHPGLQLYYTNVRYLNRTTDFTRNIGSQLYSIMKSWELAKDSGVEYDMMIRLRNDCIIENFGNIFTRDTSFLKDEVLVVNGNSHRHAFGGGGCNKCTLEYPTRKHTDHVNDVCDIMYLGNPSVMARVCNMFNDARKLVLSFKEYNELAMKDEDVRACLVPYPDAMGVKAPKIYESRIKCFYPERLIREYMKDYWLLTDMLGLVTREKYQG